ncbi:MAG: hypothetical protein KatS3mg076_0262 [Candidatus Binatia bacterium]|nr:MAG: hypothetical protein KatS3mg076_0262 [Candidatus Binatia bacterium]
MEFVDEPARRTPVLRRTDVLVVGGGSAGVAAAVAAARNGVHTMLVERYGSLGGLATGGLIVLFLTLDDGEGRQVVRGICEEVTQRLAGRGAAFFPPEQEWGSPDPVRIEHYRQWGLVWGKGPHRVRYSVAYDPEELRFVLAEMACESGVELLLHAWACELLREGTRVRGAVFQGKSGRFAVLARVVVDATGDGDLFASAGVAHEKERVLPWLWFRMGGIEDLETEIARGGWMFRTVNPGQALFPWGATESVAKIDATDPVDLTRAEIECRRKVMEEVARLRRENPRFRRAHLCDIATQLGITESRRLVGVHVLRRDEADVLFPDSVAVTGNWTKYGMRYSIPYRCLLPREFSNLLVAGRCISVDHRVHHATKEIPACMATGEAAGTAAALAVRTGVDAADLPVPRLQSKLEEQGAIVRW